VYDADPSDPNDLDGSPENGVACESPYESQNTQPSELHFRVLLTEGNADRLAFVELS
jgi:hypothetical protein